MTSRNFQDVCPVSRETVQTAVLLDTIFGKADTTAQEHLIDALTEYMIDSYSH